VDVLTADESEVRRIRGSEVAMIFQDPLSALNPYYTVGKQIAEAYLVHHPEASKADARKVTLEMLKKVGIPNPEKRIDEFPHQFSGGMRQRIVIAIALINNPKVLIADEPTTALDVTVQAQILDLMKDLQVEFNMAIVLITHDLGVIAEAALDVLVMYGGRIVERSTVEALFSEPTHPYAWGLLGAVNSLESSGRGALVTIAGSPPSLIALPPGCSFNPRCSYSSDICRTEIPLLRAVGTQGSVAACHLPEGDILSLGRKAASR
jgi:peptide/nickel transport system ATP-binding protein